MHFFYFKTKKNSTQNFLTLRNIPLKRHSLSFKMESWEDYPIEIHEIEILNDEIRIKEEWQASEDGAHLKNIDRMILQSDETKQHAQRRGTKDRKRIRGAYTHKDAQLKTGKEFPNTFSWNLPVYTRIQKLKLKSDGRHGTRFT